MSQYRFYRDCWVGQNYYPAGPTVYATADENVANNTLPIGWVPPANAVDPLNTAAVNAVYAAGPIAPGLCRAQFSVVGVAKPVTFWTPTITPGSETTSWSLTGLGVGLAPINI